jgi:peptidyl-prolyl cis-trans isomerase C
MCIRKRIQFLALSALVALPAVAAAAEAPATPAEPASKAAPASAAAKEIDLFGDTLVAKGKGVEVKRSTLDDAMVNLKANFAQRGQRLPADKMTAIEQDMLDRLVQIQLLLAKATDADKEAGKAATTARLQAVKTRAKSEEAFNRELKAMGTSQEVLKQKWTEEATAETVLERILNIKVPDAEVKKYFDENPAKFEQPEMVRANHILFLLKDPNTGADLSQEKKAAKRKQAEDVLKRAQAGEDFAKLAKEFSDDTASKDSGGELTFGRGQPGIPPEFEAAAFSLKTNQVSDIVTTQFGYHIIKLAEKTPAKQLEFAQVSQDIKAFLKQQEVMKRQDEYQKYIETLKKEADLKILDERLIPKPGDATAAPAVPAPAKPEPTKK